MPDGGPDRLPGQQVTPSPAAAAVLRASADGLIPRMAERLRRDIPSYAADDAEAQRTVLEVCRLNVTCLVAALETGRLPTAEDLTEARVAARRRAQEDFSLDALLRAYRVGLAAIWEYVADQTDDLATVRPFVDAMFAYQDHVLSIISADYVLERSHIATSTDRLHAELIDLLVRDGPRSAEARRRAGTFRVAIADAYRVAAIRLATPGSTGALDQLAWALRQLVSGGSPALVAREEGWLLVLLPHGPNGRMPSWPEGSVVALAGRALELGVARDEARRVMRLLPGRDPGVYTLDDVPLEALIDHADERLRAVLTEKVAALLEADADYAATIAALIDADGAAATAAGRLRIHRNTMAYRIARVQQITGLDPRRTRDLWLLHTAFTVARRPTA